MLNIVKIQNGIRFNNFDWIFTSNNDYPDGYIINSDKIVHVCLNKNNIVFFDCIEATIDGNQYETSQEFIDALYL